MTAAEVERLAHHERLALVAFAQRRARNRQDAEDAVQEALTIAFAISERIRPDGAVGYIAVTAAHEASRLRRHADRHRSLDQPLSGAPTWRLHDVTADPRQISRDAVIDALAPCGRSSPTRRARSWPAPSAGGTGRSATYLGATGVARGEAWLVTSATCRRRRGRVREAARCRCSA